MRINNKNIDKLLFDKLVQLYKAEKYKELDEKLIQLTKEYPKSFSLFNLLGAVKKSLKDFVGSQIAFKKAISINDKNSEAYNNLGLLYLEMKKFSQAASVFQNAINLNPNNFFFYNNLGISLLERNQLDEAKKYFEKSLNLNPRFVQSINNLGVILSKSGNYDEAILYFKKATDIDPKFLEAYLNLAELYGNIGDINLGIECCKICLNLNPKIPRPYFILGNLLKNLNKNDEAIQAYEKSLSLDPNNYAIYNNLANIFIRVQKIDKALIFYKKAYELNNQCSSAYISYIFYKRSIFDWNIIEDLHKNKIKIGIEGEPISPFFTLSLEDNPKNQMKRSIKWSENKLNKYVKLNNNQKIIKNKKIKIGYFSSDYYDHATMYLISGLFNSHDNNLFDVYLFSYGNPPESKLVDNIKKKIYSFKDISFKSDKEILEIVTEAQIDIAIDLKGHTFGSRSELFSYRLAPIQINFLGYPGTMGSNFIDYLIADKVIVNEENRKYYSEKILFMPNCYQPNDNKRLIKKTNKKKEDYGLPNNSFVLCCFNSSYKISLIEFEIWLEILNKVENSVLWLLEVEEAAKVNLFKYLEKLNIKSNRIIFAKKIDHHEHLERISHADLFIDTFNYNAHTTCSDALWAGVPVVTKKGNQFSSRVAASLLSSLGLKELITKTKDDYKNLILNLSLNSNKLNEVKAKLKKNILTYPLFDTLKYTKNFEKGLIKIYENRLNNLKDEDIEI